MTERKSADYHEVYKRIKFADRIANRPDFEIDYRFHRKELIESIKTEKDGHLKTLKQRELKGTNRTLHWVQQALMARYS